MALTELALKNMKPKAKVYRLADSHGLCIEVTPQGSKLWRYRYYFNGKGQMLALGRYPEVSLAQARKLRDEAREQAKSGQHPTRIRKAQKLRRMQEGENTFERIARRWFELKDGTQNQKYHKQNLERMQQLVFPVIGALPITEITIPDVVQVVEKIGKRGTIETAKRMKQIISQIFRYAAQRGLCQQNPAADLRDILPSAQRKHHPCVSIAELPELLQAIDAREEDMSKYAMQLLALTFVRTGELIGAKWAEIDWDRQEWHIPAERMKMKRPHTVPLSKQAIENLTKLYILTGKRDFIFFSGASKSKHLSNGTVLMALRRMGYQNKMSGHGFRTLASTILNEKGYSSDVIEKQLAHEDQDKIRAAFSFFIQETELVEHAVKTSKIIWNSELVDAQKILFPASSSTDNKGSAVKFLQELLAGGRKVSSNEVFEAAKALGYSKAQIRRAGEKLGVDPKKEGMDGGWYWQLPKEVDPINLHKLQMLQIGETVEDDEDIPFM